MKLQNPILIILIVLPILGFISLTKPLFRFSKWLYSTFLRPPKNLTSYGSWALVTGSTDGIGKALALELASKGLNLVLVGRNPLKLAETTREIKTKHDDRILIKTVVIDFSTCPGPGENVAKIIEEETRGLDLGIVINNVGLAYPYARYFHELDLELLDRLLKVNVESVNWVTKSVVPEMVRKKKGAIVNIGSGSAGCVPRYVAMLSRSLSLEYKQHGIDVQCQIPLLVATKMSMIKKASFFTPSAETYSKASVKWIGHDAICVPYWPHALQVCILRAFPEALLDWCLLRYFVGIRTKAMRKESKMLERMKDQKKQ